MIPGLLLDTHILMHWVVEPGRLSREQLRVLRAAELRSEPLAISDITLVEIAQLVRRGSARLRISVEEVFRVLENDVIGFQIRPITILIAREVPHLTQVLRDPADCVIAATARVHGLRLLTSDQRLLDANVVSTIG